MKETMNSSDQLGFYSEWSARKSVFWLLTLITKRHPANRANASPVFLINGYKPL